MESKNVRELIGAVLTGRLESFFNQLAAFDKICIFGTGRVGGELIRIFQDRKIKTDFFCDNNPQKWDIEFYGVKCISPTELRSYAGNMCAIGQEGFCIWAGLFLRQRLLKLG